MQYVDNQIALLWAQEGLATQLFLVSSRNVPPELTAAENRTTFLSHD